MPLNKEIKPNQILNRSIDILTHVWSQNFDEFESLIKVKLATVVEGDPKAPFSIVTTPRCWGGFYSFPRIDPLPLIRICVLSVKQGGIKYHFLSLWYD